MTDASVAVGVGMVAVASVSAIIGTVLCYVTKVTLIN